MTYMKLSAIMGAALLLGACETTQNAMARQQRVWIGQPVQEFAETHSLAPVSIYRDTYGTMTYIFRKPVGYGSCGITVKTVAGDYERDQRIVEMTSTCPPGTL